MLQKAPFWVVEAGESRTLWPIDLAIFNVPPHLPYDYISGILELNIRQVHSIFDLEADPAMLLPLLLNQLIILGQTAQQFQQALEY
ncbi:hypothetical protein ACFLUJ_07220 [Chloroflexota bacterium]